MPDTTTIRQPVSVRSHTYRITVTVLKYTDSGLFGHDFSSSAGEHLHASRETAQTDADVCVVGVGHECDRGCTGWRL